MILLEYHNRILLDTIKERLESDKQFIIDIIFSDFDGVKFHVWVDKDATNIVIVSISWAVIPALLENGAQAKLQKEYGLFLASEAEAGYDVTLKINIDTIKPAQKARLPMHIAMLKRNLFAAPFAKFFDACQAGKDIPMLELKYRHGEGVFLKTQGDRLIVIFNVLFVDPDDQLLGKVFVEEFVSTRKSITAAPSVSFSLDDVPRELDGYDLTVNEEEKQGFISFVLHPQHMKRRASTISNLQIFRNYLHYHIKCSKAYMHTRMRSRVRSLLQVLNRAKVDALVKTKKTFSGKTFKRR